jgi:hypothetical protein
VRDLSVNIRQATPDDAHLLANLGARTFRDTFGPDNTEADLANHLASAFGPATQRGELEDEHTSGRDRPILCRCSLDPPGVATAPVRTRLEPAMLWGNNVAWLDMRERDSHAKAFSEKMGLYRCRRPALPTGKRRAE